MEEKAPSSIPPRAVCVEGLARLEFWLLPGRPEADGFVLTTCRSGAPLHEPASLESYSPSGNLDFIRCKRRHQAFIAAAFAFQGPLRGIKA
jgi:hypothetical protein